MMLGEWRVHIQQAPWANLNYVLLIRDLAKGTEYIDHNGLSHLVPEGSLPQLEDSYFAKLNDEQLQALADAIAKKGVKTINDHKIEGLLEATQYHLEDMRKIVFRSK